MSTGTGCERAQARKLLLLVVGTVLLVAAGAIVASAIDPGDPAQLSESDSSDSPDDATASWPGNATTIAGAAANDSAGTSVTAVGDVNGDGVTDIAIGAPGADGGSEDAGAVYLFYGPVEPETALDDANATLVGESAGDEAGRAVDGIGDLDGDGADEVLVGAPLHGEADAGASYVVSGDGLAGTVDLGEADVALEGTAGDRVGWSVADGADAAGAPTVIVGAPRYDAGGEAETRDAGAAYLVTNETLDRARSLGAEAPDEQVTLSLDRDADATLVGESDRGLAGWAVDTGDVNDDGTADVVVGARKHNASASASASASSSANASASSSDDGTNAGAAYVVHGPVSGTADLSTAALQLSGEAGGDQAGYAVASGNDVDGDGVDDVVVGAPFHNPSEDRQNAGAAYVVAGGAHTGNLSLAEANATLAGEGVDHRAGWALTTGEATCDDAGDVLVGAPRLGDAGDRAGGAYLVAGGGTLDGDVDLAGADRTFTGASAGDEAGRAVALPGDLNGDDIPDVGLGAPFVDADAETPNAGAATLHVGACPDEQAATDTPEEAAAEGDATAASAAETETATESPAAGEVETDADSETTNGTDTTTGAADGTEAPLETNTTNETESPNGTESPDDTETTDSTEASNDTTTPDGTNASTQTESAAGTETAGDQTDASNDTEAADDEDASGDAAAAAGQAASLEVDISCERGEAYVHNPNDFQVTVTIDGPDGTTSEGVGPTQDLGGPAAPSLNGDNLPAGEYTVTAEDANGNSVPVNGDASWSTTVKDCPTTTVQTQCTDGDTLQLSVSAENLEGRHANPVDVQVQSPDLGNRESSQRVTPQNGVVQTTVSLSDDAASTITIDLANYQPSLLATLTIEPGACDGLAGGSDDAAGASASEASDDGGAETGDETDDESQTGGDGGVDQAAAEETEDTEETGDEETSESAAGDEDQAGDVEGDSTEQDGTQGNDGEQEAGDDGTTEATAGDETGGSGDETAEADDGQDGGDATAATGDQAATSGNESAA